METKKAIFTNSKEENQVYFITVVNMSLFVWFMKAKVYKVVMYSLFCFELPCKPLNSSSSLV